MYFPALSVLCLLVNNKPSNTAPVNLVTPSFSALTSPQSSRINNNISTKSPRSSFTHRKTLTLNSTGLSLPTITRKNIVSDKTTMYPTNTFAIRPCIVNCTRRNDTNKNGTVVVPKRHKHRNLFALIIGVLSLVGLVANFVFMTKICSCNGVPVIVLFGICLMLFNIILSFYGIALAGYLYKGPIHWNDRFCQGFTSIKLFALGSGVWTLIMFTFHASIKESTETEREAVFKGIVYVLEGVMLSGVMAVMAWIKLDSWDFLCSILEPRTTVEWLLTGIEIWYYVIALILVVRYPIHLLRTMINKVEESKQKRGDGNVIFTFILSCFIIWIAGFVLTLPQVGLFSSEVSATVRVAVLMSVLLLQPFLYTLAKNSKYRKKRNKSVEDVLLVCECTGSETCPACDSEYDPRGRYGDTKFIEPSEKDTAASSDDQLNNDLDAKRLKRRKKQKVAKTKEIIKKNKKRKSKSKGDVASPKAICRSPVIRTTIEGESLASEEESKKGEESGPLLVKVPVEELKQHLQPSQRQVGNNENVPLLDDMDGKENPPKALVDGSPAKENLESPSGTRQSEFPSFINLKTAVNVDELPKERKPKFLELKEKASPNSDVARVSRGPTFYQIPGKISKDHENVLTSPQKKSVKPETIPEGPKSPAGKKEKRKRRKKISERKDSANKSGHEKKLSTHSLEWDYSDSSGSLSEDKVPVVETPVRPSGEAIKDNMEWDPAGCEIQVSDGSSAINQLESSPTPEWEPYATEEARSSSVLNAMSKPTAHLSKDVSFDNGSSEMTTEAVFDAGTNKHDNENGTPEKQQAGEQKEKGKKNKKKQVNGKVKKPKKKEKRKEEKTNS